MKNNLYCFAAIFLIGSSALRGCAGAAFRHIPEFFEKVNPVRIIKEHPGYAYGAKKVVESIDSLDFDASAHNRQISHYPSYNQLGSHSSSVELDLSYQQKRLDEMMREVNRSILYSSSHQQNMQGQQHELSEYEEWINQFQRSKDSCSTANIWNNPIPLKKARYLQMNNSYPAN